MDQIQNCPGAQPECPVTTHFEELSQYRKLGIACFLTVTFISFSIRAERGISMAQNATVISNRNSRRFSPRAVVSILLLVGLPAGLIGYQARGGLKRMNEWRATGSLAIRTAALHRPPSAEFVATGA
jgi:hypothetical protein